MTKQANPAAVAVGCLGMLALCGGVGFVACGGLGGVVVDSARKAANRPPRPKATDQVQQERYVAIRELARLEIVQRIEVPNTFPKIYVGRAFWMLTFEQKEVFLGVVLAFLYEVPPGGSLEATEFGRLFEPWNGEQIGTFDYTGLDVWADPTLVQLTTAVEPGDFVVPHGFKPHPELTGPIAIERPDEAPPDLADVINAAEETAPAKPEPVKRSWTRADGTPIGERAFAGVLSKKVRLRDADGQVEVVPLDELSEADQQFIRDRAKAARPGF
jgi:hypothetical protein